MLGLDDSNCHSQPEGVGPHCYPPMVKHLTVPSTGADPKILAVRRLTSAPLLMEDDQPFPFGDFRNRFIVSAEGYPTWDQYHCTGGRVIPDQPFACPPESTMRRMS